MKTLYGNVLEEVVPTKDEWKDASKLNWYNPRTAALGTLDTALQLLDSNPSIANFDQVVNRYRAWRNTKRNPDTGAPASKRGTAANALVDQLRDRKRILDDRVILMQRVRQLVDAIDWKRKCLCAELYDPTDPNDWGVISESVNWLAAEARASSGWANVFPENIAELAERGEAEIDAVNQWPNIGYRTKAALARWYHSETDIIVAPHEVVWPPWDGHPHVRKGLFCHSSAAIAAYVIHANRAQLHGGLHCQIRSIDVVHQQPREKGEMTHWWICVNRPDELRLKNRVIRFTRTPDFDFLPLMGGFVVDIWGALWREQENHGHQWATSAQSAQYSSVSDTPTIQIAHSDEKTKIQVHHVY